MLLSKCAKETLSTDNKIYNLGKDFANSKGSMFLGRGYSYPISLEGALKLKELAYVHAEGYPAGEMKHGPLALIEEGMPVVVIAPRDEHYKKTISNMQEVISRGAKVLLITNKSTDEIFVHNKYNTSIWPKKAFVEATPISGPQWIGKTKSASLAIELSTTFTIAHVLTSFFLHKSSAANVSAVSPDWETNT